MADHQVSERVAMHSVKLEEHEKTINKHSHQISRLEKVLLVLGGVVIGLISSDPVQFWSILKALLS